MMHLCAIATPQGGTQCDVIKRCMHTHITTRINSACPDVGGESDHPDDAKARNAKIAWLCSRWAADTAQLIGMPQTYQGVHREYSNRWQADKRVNESGVVSGLGRSPLAQWNDDNKPPKKLLRCEGKDKDLRLLCSNPSQNIVWTEIVYE